MTGERGAYGCCAWCGKPANTEIYASGSPRSKKPTMAPVCDDHERMFLAQGAQSRRSVHQEREDGRKRSREAWKARIRR